MRNQLSAYLDNLISALVVFVAGITPLLFLNQTTEFYEMPKLVFLIVSVTVIFGLWIFSWILKGKITITRTPLDIPLILLLVAIIASTFFSSSRIISIYGNFPRVHGSAVSWIVYILLYFLAVSNFKTPEQIKSLLYVLCVSGTLVAAVTLMSFFGIYLPFDFARAVNFTPTGSSFSTIAFLLLLLPLTLTSIIKPNKYLSLPVALFCATLFSIAVVLTGSMPVYVILGLIYIVTFFTSKKHNLKTIPLYLLPVVVTVAVFIFSYLPVDGVNKMQQLEANFPKEVQLPLSISWKISASAFRDAPFIGTGPSTYLFNFNTYKPGEFNNLSFWSVPFDSAYNEVLQILGTLGLFGFISFLLICFVVLINSWGNISPVSSNDEHDNFFHVFLPGFSISAMVAIALFLVHAATLVSLVMTFLFFAALMASQKTIREKLIHLSAGIKASTGDRQFDLLPVIIFVVFLIGAAPLLFNTFNATLADYFHKKALLQADKSGTLTYQNLQKAESLNPYIDLYRVDMAQTNFALANALATQKGPSTSNPKGTLTDEDKKTIQTLLSQAINEGRVSVALSPESSRNWEVLATIYRNITGIAQNAIAFSLDAYGRAIQRDPLNPALRLSVGGIYYSAKNYPLAVRFFTDAANLKPDYINAYYNLAIALRDSGDYQNALTVAQQTVALMQQKRITSGSDYQTAQALVADLKTKVDELSKSQAGKSSSQKTQTPSNQTNALQNSNISTVNVNSLNNPPKATPPPAVAPNPQAKVPQISPTTQTPTPTQK